MAKPRAHTVRQASALLAVAALLSNALGLFRNILFYRLFPLEQLDLYFASFRVADFIFNLLIVGAISSAFIPAASELIAHGRKEEADRLANQLLTLATLFFLGLGLVLALAMPWLIRLIVPNFDAASQAQTVQLSRLLLIQTVFFSWSYILGGLLNARRRFAGYAMAPLLYNVSIIVFALFGQRYGISSITWGVVCGSLLHFAIQFREAWLLGFRPRPSLQITPAIRHIVTVMIPRSISQGMAQLVLIAYTALISGLPRGSLAIFTGMNDLQTTPTVIIGNSLATAFFPALAGFIAVSDGQKASVLLNKVIQVSLFILVPTLALLVVTRAQVVRLYIASGHSITWEQTDLAIRTLLWFLVGIIPASLVAILARVFYGLKDTLTPMLISLLSGAIAIAVAWIGIARGGDISLLGLSESLVSLVQCGLYLFVLRKREILSLSAANLIGPTFTYLVGGALVAIGSWSALRLADGLYRASGYDTTRHISGLLFQLVAASAVGLLLYLGYSTLRSKEELKWLRKSGL